MGNLLVNYPGIKPVTLTGIRSAKGAVSQRVHLAFGLLDFLIDGAPMHSKSHAQDHSLRMLNNLHVIKKHVGDPELLQIAIILHDVGVFYSQAMCHGDVSALKIKPHLPKLKLSRAEQVRVCSMIRAHDDTGFIDNSREAKALRILDTLDAFGNIGVYRHLEIYWRRGLRPPKIHEKAIASLKNRREKIEDVWFLLADLEVINNSYERARDVLIHMVTECENAQFILDAFLEIEWEIDRFPDVLQNEEFAQFDFVQRFFRNLSGEIGLM